MKIPLSFIIPARNEERNIRAAIDSVAEWADQVFVLDSYSDDRTTAIAEAMGAQVARRRFDNFSAQKNWALDNLPLRTDWVLFLDADERVPCSLRRELEHLLSHPAVQLDGYYVGMEHLFMGAVISHGGWYPNDRLLLFKHRLGRYEPRIVHEHLILQGKTGRLANLLIHDDRKGLHRYFERHNMYSTMEALEAHRYLHRDKTERSLTAGRLDATRERRRALKQWAYRRLPCRPLFRFLWTYVLRRGFLDGRVGLRYSLLQAFYEYQISLKLLELQTDSKSPMLKYEAADRVAEPPSTAVRMASVHEE